MTIPVIVREWVSDPQGSRSVATARWSLPALTLLLNEEADNRRRDPSHSACSSVEKIFVGARIVTDPLGSAGRQRMSERIVDALLSNVPHLGGPLDNVGSEDSSVRSNFLCRLLMSSEGVCDEILEAVRGSPDLASACLAYLRARLESGSPNLRVLSTLRIFEYGGGYRATSLKAREVAAKTWLFSGILDIFDRFMPQLIQNRACSGEQRLLICGHLPC